MSTALQGRVVAITGGARGIGLATAKAFAAAGARVAIGDLNADLAKQAASEIHGDVLALPLDVTSPAIAHEFCMTERTLHRRLAAEHTSYRALVDEVGGTLASALLESGLTVEETARQLGYSETAAFTRHSSACAVSRPVNGGGAVARPSKSLERLGFPDQPWRAHRLPTQPRPKSCRRIRGGSAHAAASRG